jgi:hypothetical protein
MRPLALVGVLLIALMFLSVPTVALATVVYRHWLEWRSGDDEVNVLPSTGTG